jgi:dienelactone hydrolase
MPNPQEIVLFHSVLGLRPGVLQNADRLREAGHIVHTPDLFDGQVFTDNAAAAICLRAIGFEQLIERSQAAVLHLPKHLVYAGFSTGGAFAELLAATRPGARGAILLHAPLLIRDLGWKVWPASVPVQVHFAQGDPLRNQQVIDGFASRVRKCGAGFQQHDYPCNGHLFADPDLPAYNAAASTVMWERVIEFLDGLAIAAATG